MEKTFEDWKAELNRDLRFYGVTGRLSKRQLERLYKAGCSVDRAYGITCDVAAGFRFAQSAAQHHVAGERVYIITSNGKRHRYPTLEDAMAVCRDVFAATRIVLGISEELA